MSSFLDQNQDIQNNSLDEDEITQHQPISSNSFFQHDNQMQINLADYSQLNILLPPQISQDNIINKKNVSFSPNKFNNLTSRSGSNNQIHSNKKSQTNDENINSQDHEMKENILNSANKLSTSIHISQNKSDCLNENKYIYEDNAVDQIDALLQKDEEISMLKTQRIVGSIENQYLKDIQSNQVYLQIIDQGENFIFYQLPQQKEIYLSNIDESEDIDISQFEKKENMNDLYIDSCIQNLIEYNQQKQNALNLESDIQLLKEEHQKIKTINDKIIMQLEGQYQIEQMHNHSLEVEKNNLIQKLAEMDVKLENQTIQFKKCQDLLREFKQEYDRLQEILEFKDVQINQLNEKKNICEDKLKDFTKINQEQMKKLEEKDQQLEDIKEKISEPIENLNMVFTIVSNYKQTLAQFDEKISEIIQKQKTIEKLEKHLADKNQQMIVLVNISKELQEQVDQLVHQNKNKELIIDKLNEKINQLKTQQNINIQQQNEQTIDNQDQEFKHNTEFENQGLVQVNIDEEDQKTEFSEEDFLEDYEENAIQLDQSDKIELFSISQKLNLDDQNNN